MIFNITGSGAGMSGATLTVNAPAGAVVTVSKDGKTKTKTAGADGVVVFKGLETGDWTCNMVSADGTQTMRPKTYHITAGYEISLTFFAATIHITYPAGSTCTANNGTTTLTAPDTSGTWDCVVPNAGPWTVSLDSAGDDRTVSLSNGTVVNVDFTVLELFARGVDFTDVTGGWTTDGRYYLYGGATVEGQYLRFYNATSKAYAGAGTVKKVNVTRYNTLRVVGKRAATGTGRAAKTGIVDDSYEFVASSNASGTVTVDISGFTGSYYVDITGLDYVTEVVMLV